MTNIETTANASMVKPNTLAISVSRFCLRSLRLYAEFITLLPMFLMLYIPALRKLGLRLLLRLEFSFYHPLFV